PARRIAEAERRQHGEQDAAALGESVRGHGAIMNARSRARQSSSEIIMIRRGELSPARRRTHPEAPTLQSDFVIAVASPKIPNIPESGDSPPRRLGSYRGAPTLPRAGLSPARIQHLSRHTAGFRLPT